MRGGSGQATAAHQRRDLTGDLIGNQRQQNPTLEAEYNGVCAYVCVVIGVHCFFAVCIVIQGWDVACRADRRHLSVLTLSRLPECACVCVCACALRGKVSECTCVCVIRYARSGRELSNPRVVLCKKFLLPICVLLPGCLHCARLLLPFPLLLFSSSLPAQSFRQREPNSALRSLPATAPHASIGVVFFLLLLFDNLRDFRASEGKRGCRGSGRTPPCALAVRRGDAGHRERRFIVVMIAASAAV